MKPKTYSRSIAIRPHEAIPDTAAMQARLEQRLAQRWGVSLPVAAVLTGLAGIGPQVREAR
ncbi:hypothetical protein MMSR116_18045 [Methylobacterium mesophilicum SR1.6/6]|uniref:Uncharacterized protein n=1 Tax=Methylobacterium mesophilicum SR1.6/6 TaxID=908290 RepID=A0A6B9FME4_9HYPH|nr:hypothetical protein [Methylobacterium mesophilicum]QGY03577.1 hypothetical protein MMSR116_18045 [Methylobacterium mesophilicum SR1.6/6]